LKAIRNGRCIIPGTAGEFITVSGKVLLYDEAGIAGLMEEDSFIPSRCSELIDAGGRYVSPGFINVHIHGCKGADTMDASSGALMTMKQFLPQTGVTSFCPTTMTCTWKEIEAALTAVREDMKKKGGGAQILGAHMEGPFISPQKKGSQEEKNILSADFSLIAPFADVIRILTMAPEELPANSSFCEACHQMGIRLSIGHTAADYQTVCHAIERQGIHRFTHLYDAMEGFHHRAPGVVGAAFDTDTYTELIADDVHSCPMAQRLAYRVKGRDRLILITDSLRACGVGDGISELGGHKVLVKGERAVLEDGTIAGSVATMNRCMRIFRKNTGASMAETVGMVTKNPAEDLGIYSEVGALSTGKRADITIFDDDVEIFATIIAGKQFKTF
jgi:N-acetylglucosamine-6-phosphate deacetylase